MFLKRQRTLRLGRYSTAHTYLVYHWRHRIHRLEFLLLSSSRSNSESVHGVYHFLHWYPGPRIGIPGLCVDQPKGFARSQQCAVRKDKSIVATAGPASCDLSGPIQPHDLYLIFYFVLSFFLPGLHRRQTFGSVRPPLRHKQHCRYLRRRGTTRADRWPDKNHFLLCAFFFFEIPRRHVILCRRLYASCLTQLGLLRLVLRHHEHGSFQSQATPC